MEKRLENPGEYTAALYQRTDELYQIPDANRSDKGIPLVNVIALSEGERITAAIAIHDTSSTQFCTMATVNGDIKRIRLSEFSSVRPSGLAAMNLAKNDELGWVRITTGKDDLIIVTANGKALHLKETEVRPVSRQAGGVTGIKLYPGDKVASLEVMEPNGFLLLPPSMALASGLRWVNILKKVEPPME